MGVHRKENLILSKIFCMVLSVVVHRKKFIHTQNHFKEQVVFFLHIVQPYEKSILPTQSRWLLNYSSMYISNE